jgi:hypothetical protein
MKGTSKNRNDDKQYKILFLHHSTGEVIKNGGVRQFPLIGRIIKRRPLMSGWFNKYNRLNDTNYVFEDMFFPGKEKYGWQNYPYDYYNIWVKHSGSRPYLNEPTLEMLTEHYSMIIFKHCYPVCNIKEDIKEPDIDSPEKRLENYKLQYIALKQKMLEFPSTKFLIWTGAAQVRNNISEESAKRAKAFFDWVRNDWYNADDNIFLWDFYELETEGTLYLKPEFASSPMDSHPNKSFAGRVYPQFCKRIIEVIEQNY